MRPAKARWVSVCKVLMFKAGADLKDVEFIINRSSPPTITTVQGSRTCHDPYRVDALRAHHSIYYSRLPQLF